MRKSTSSKIAAYSATVTVLGGASVQGAIIHSTFEQYSADPSPVTLDSNTHTIGAVKFNGTALVSDRTSAGGAVTISAIENYTQSGQVKVSGGTAYSNLGYVISAEILASGEVIGNAFTQTGTTMNLPAGSASNVYLGFSTANHQYGWIRFSYTDGGKTVTIHDAALETTPNKQIVAGSTTATAAVSPASSRAGADAAMAASSGSSAPAVAGLAGGLFALRRRRSTGARG